MKKKFKIFDVWKDKRLESIKSGGNYEGDLGMHKGSSTYQKYANQENSLVFLLSELIDNSINSFRNMYKNPEIKWKLINTRFVPEIEINLSDQDENGEPKITIKDNAMGFAPSEKHFDINWKESNFVIKSQHNDDDWSEFNDGFKQGTIGIGENTKVIWIYYGQNETIETEMKKEKAIRNKNNPQFVFRNSNHGTIIEITKLRQKVLSLFADANKDNKDRLKHALADKYKKWTSKEGNSLNFSIKITINNEDISKYFSNYEYFPYPNEENEEFKLFFKNDSYKLTELIDSGSDDNKKWMTIKDFLTYEYRGEKLYKIILDGNSKKIFLDKISVEFSIKYSEIFHKNLYDFFKNNIRLGLDEKQILDKLYKLLFARNTPGDNIYWIDKIRIEVGDKKWCKNKEHTSHHDLVLCTWITSTVKGKNNTLSFQNKVDNNTGFTIEGKEKLIIFGDNKEPFYGRFLSEQLKKCGGGKDTTYPKRITGNIFVPVCFETDNNKKRLNNQDNLMNEFGHLKDKKKFEQLFINDGKILASFLLMNFKDYVSKKKAAENKKNKSPAQCQKEVIKNNDKYNQLLSISNIGNLKISDVNREEFSSQYFQQWKKLELTTKTHKKFWSPFKIKINDEIYAFIFIISSNCGVFIDISDTEAKKNEWNNTYIVCSSEKIFTKMFLEKTGKFVAKSFSYHCFYILVKQFIKYYILLINAEKFGEADSFIENLNKLYEYK